ncbi:MAG: hypothetical protein ACPGEG_03495 [Salibacteraceae bacterium]
MKYLLLTILLIPLIGFSQIDTVNQGKVEFIDSTSNLKIVYPFKKRMVNGEVTAYNLSDQTIAFSGKSIDNARQGIWYYFKTDSIGVLDTLAFYTYLNDTLNGPFQKMEDSIRIQGNNKNNLLNGSYKREYSIINDSGLTIWVPIDSGQFADSVPYGQWTYFSSGRLYETGFFEDGKKSKNWMTYDLMEKSDKNVIINETRYFEGKKTGNQIRYFRYEYETNDDGTIDTIKINEFEQIPWQGDQKLGTYFKKNENGDILIKGNYSKDQKVSTWVYYDPETLVKETKTHLNNSLNGPYIKQVDEHILIDGVYAMGKKNKTWKFHDDNGNLIREEGYDKGIKTGEWKYYNFKGYVAFTKEFENDKLVALTEYNDHEVDILSLEISKVDNGFEIVTEELFEDSVVSKTFLFSPEDKKIHHEHFMELFKEKANDTSIFVLNGGYTVRKSGSIELSGNYKMNLMDGNWDYFYNTSIIWRKVFADGLLISESFIEKHTGNPLDKGEYVLWYGPERPKVEFKIKEGVRNGKSTWYKKGGEVLKEEKYKEGILQ